MTTATYDPLHEVRFAVVLYGGVSLAIYINGVTQELLRMVRATADLTPEEVASLSPTEKIYREIGQQLGRSKDADAKIGTTKAPDLDQPVSTRFVVDIVSGTSAGGINGVALAKALALRASNMTSLKDTWIDEADINKLFASPDQAPVTALLDSNHMYGIIYKTLTNMNAAATATPPGRTPFADEVDLYVTTTDLNGIYEPVQLADRTVMERVHKHVFHFRHDPEDAKRQQFGPEWDALLAYAARCTSSFPIAFAPMSFDQLKPVFPEAGTYDKLRDQAKDCFTAARAREVDLPFDERPFADGGYLDNHPFGHAIDAVKYRTSERPVTRKLLYIDPFPEYAADHRASVDIGPLRNAMLAASALPRYQTIRGEIDRINDSNRRQDRLKVLLRDLDKALEAGIDPVGAAAPTTNRAYITLRAQLTTADLADVFARAADFKPGGDAEYFVLLLVRAYRETHYQARDPRDPADLAGYLAFLDAFDLEYRRRRLDDLINRLDARIFEAALPADDPRRAVRNRLSELLDALNTQRAKTIARVHERATGLTAGFVADFSAVMKSDLDDRLKRSAEVYGRRSPELDPIVDAVRQLFGDVLPASDVAVRECVEQSGDPQLVADFARFDLRDAIVLPMFDGTAAREHTEIEVYRVSPADSTVALHGIERPDKKLAGIAFGDFGAFLQESWRKNDMMWGRLDGAERIIGALVPPGEGRTALIARAWDEILKEDLDGLMMTWLKQRVNDNRAVQHTVDQYITAADANRRVFIERFYQVPEEPAPQRLFPTVSMGLRLVNRMLEDDKGDGSFGPRLGAALRLPAQLVAQIARFGLPGTHGRYILGHWLFVVALAALLLLVVAPLFGVQGVSQIGWIAIVGAALIWLLTEVIAQRLNMPERDRGAEGAKPQPTRPHSRRRRRLVGAGIALLLFIPWALGVAGLARWLDLLPSWAAGLLPW